MRRETRRRNKFRIIGRGRWTRVLSARPWISPKSCRKSAGTCERKESPLGGERPQWPRKSPQAAFADVIPRNAATRFIDHLLMRSTGKRESAHLGIALLSLARSYASRCPSFLFVFSFSFHSWCRERDEASPPSCRVKIRKGLHGDASSWKCKFLQQAEAQGVQLVFLSIILR